MPFLGALCAALWQTASDLNAKHLSASSNNLFPQFTKNKLSDNPDVLFQGLFDDLSNPC